jgi:hypothetical protein
MDSVTLQELGKNLTFVSRSRKSRHMGSRVSLLEMLVTLHCMILGLVIVPAAAAAEDVVATWQRWEHVLVSDRDYANPCTDVTVHVRFDGPDEQARDGLGFWDGDRRFVIRCAFPAPGEWRWLTTCSDTANRGLHGHAGVVQVGRSNESNRLRRHGYLRPSDDGRLLVHADGTPFLWIGDTCWAAPVRAVAEEWKRYVADRAARGYTVLQLAIAPDWALKGSGLGLPPFLSALPDIRKPNPRFFQEMDRKLALANDHGLVVMMVGLMETPYRYPAPEQVAVLSRYVAARYSSFAVIFSPSFDSGIHEAETVAAADAIREAAPANLVTMHMGTGVGPHFHAADWLSFDMYQSGHNAGNRARQSARATGMAAEILALAPRKPIVNGEAIYEGDLGGAYDVRRTGWLSFLSGAVGYTAGINEVYAWEEDATAKMDVPSSGQISLLARFLRAVPWWSLEPAPRRILNQPHDRERLMAFALSADRSLGIAYLPGNRAIELDLKGCAASYHALWLNPATGSMLAGASVAASNKATLTAPDERDWALVLATPGCMALKQVKTVFAQAPHFRIPTTASIAFGRRAGVDGLVLKQPGDGEFASQTFKGVACIVNDDPQRNSYLYIDVDDRLAFRGGVRRMRVEVRLQSEAPLDRIQLQYDGQGPAETSNIYRAVAPPWRKQENGWTVVGFVAESPYLGNRQNAGADFRVFLDGRLCRVASLKVALEQGDATRG